jgi:carbon monoxide dehydrogenase subunit G
LVRIERSIEIKVSPDKVWEMLAFDKTVEWIEDWKSVEYTSEIRTPEDKYKVGASAHIIERRWEYDLKITESLKNEKMPVQSKGKYACTTTYILKPVADEGTKLTYMSEYGTKGILGKTFAKLFAGTLEKQVDQALGKLKSILEE